MKQFLLIALMFTGLIACDNDAAYEVDDKIESAFVLEYPEATKASWRADEAGGYYDVVFTDRGNELTARYDRNGKRVRTDNDNDDYDQRESEARTVRTSATTTVRMNRNVTDYDTDTQTNLTRLGFNNTIPMLESEVSLEALTNEVEMAIKKDYKGWTIHKVKQIEQDDRKLMKIELKSEALDKEVKPMYTLDGNLVGIDD